MKADWKNWLRTNLFRIPEIQNISPGWGAKQSWFASLYQGTGKCHVSLQKPIAAGSQCVHCGHIPCKTPQPHGQGCGIRLKISRYLVTLGHTWSLGWDESYVIKWWLWQPEGYSKKVEQDCSRPKAMSKCAPWLVASKHCPFRQNTPSALPPKQGNRLYTSFSANTHTHAKNCHCEFCGGMHLTCKNTPATPDRNGSVKRPEKVSEGYHCHSQCSGSQKLFWKNCWHKSQIAGTHVSYMKKVNEVKLQTVRRGSSWVGHVPCPESKIFAGTSGWSVPISSQLMSSFIGSGLRVGHCPLQIIMTRSKQIRKSHR